MIWLLYTNVLVLVLLSVVVLVENKGIDAFSMIPAVIPSATTSLSSSSSSSRCYQSTSNDDSKSSISTSTTNNSSVGRLEFAYKRVNNADAEADPPPSKSELRSTEPDVIAESIEKLVKEQQDQAIEQAFIGSLDAWMFASNKNKGKENNDNNRSTSISSVLKYGLRMEDVLTMMETNCATGVTIDAYATVIHLYLGGKEPIAALCVLGRMEHQLHLIQQQQQQQQQKKNNEFQNSKGRLIQYNRVLQGLVQSPASSAASLSVAVQLLISMCVQEEFVYDPTTMPYNGNNVDANNENGTVVLVVPTFLPIHVTPDAKSFATVIVPMIHQSIAKKEENAHDEEEDQRILQLMQHAQRLDQLQVHGFLSNKITAAIVTAKMAMTEYDWDYDNYDNLKERIDDLLLDRASVDTL